MNQVEKKVLEKITPSNKYRKEIKKITCEVEEKLEHEIKKRHLLAEIEIVGSIAKDTYLKNDLDIDFFIKFPTKVKKEEIGRNAISIGKAILEDTEQSYAEHPYIRGYYKKYKVEVVPCYKIEKASQKLSAVDRTPLHTKYVKENIREAQKKDVRLFKQFLKGTGCYGAEAEIEGFSGYLCEILILRYGSFKNLIEKAQKWKPKEKLTLTKEEYKSFETPLIFIDPVDADRNVASALSKEKFDFFKKACKEYLKKPSVKFFFPNKVKPWTLSKISKVIEKQKCQYVGIKIQKPDIIPENLYPQVRKAIRSIEDTCSRYDFKIFDSRFHIDEKNIYIIIKADTAPLSKTTIHAGPPINLKENIDDFIKKWKDDNRVIKKPYVKNDRYYVEIKRDYTQIYEFLEDQIKNLSLGKHIEPVAKRKFVVLETKNLIKDEFKLFWTEYLDEKMLWER